MKMKHPICLQENTIPYEAWMWDEFNSEAIENIIQNFKRSNTMAKHSNPNNEENTIPYEQINPSRMREEAERHGSTDPRMHKQHERQIAELDKGEGAIKGGR
jgi:hypothetical protein